MLSFSEGYELILALHTRIPMASKKTRRNLLNPRKAPLQRRSTETVAVILEAAARILELRGFEGFNTNAIADRAGVSIGSLYQYFPNKEALLSGLISRESAPLLAAVKNLARIQSCEVALTEYIRASMRHQMTRPKLATLIDEAEKRDTFQHQVSGTRNLLQDAMVDILRLPDAPAVNDVMLASGDLLAIIRALIDVAGERGEAASANLVQRVEAAVRGYLQSSCS